MVAAGAGIPCVYYTLPVKPHYAHDRDLQGPVNCSSAIVRTTTSFLPLPLAAICQILLWNYYLTTIIPHVVICLPRPGGKRPERDGRVNDLPGPLASS